MSTPPRTNAPVFPTTLGGSVVALLMLGGWLAWLGSFIGLLGDRIWVCDLFSHFRLQYAGLILVALGASVVSRRWKASGALAAGLVLNLVLLAPLLIKPTLPFEGAGQAFRVAAFNVLTANRQHEAVADWVVTQDADVVLMQEVNRRWAEALETQLAGYRALPTDTVREDNFGLLVFVRDGVAVAESEAFVDPAGLPRIEAVVELAGRRVRVIAVHT